MILSVHLPHSWHCAAQWERWLGQHHRVGFFPWPLWLKSYLGPSEHCGSISPRVSQFHFGLLSLVSTLFFFTFRRSLSLGLMFHPHVVDASDRPVPKSPVQFTSTNLGSTNGSVSDLDGMGTRPGVTTDEKLDALLSQFAQVKEQIAQIRTIEGWMSRMESHVTTALGGFAARLTEMEQNFSALTARMCKIDTCVPSASNVSGSARFLAFTRTG